MVLYFVIHPTAVAAIKEVKGDLLVSYVNNAKTVSKEGTIWDFGHKLLDCGAWSVYNSGKVLDTDDYISYVTQNTLFDVFIGHDIIPVFNKISALESAEKTYANTLYMLDRLPPERAKDLMTVFHHSEPFSNLKRLIELKVNGNHLERICLAPNNVIGKKHVWDYLDNCYSIIANSTNKDIKTHILGVTDFKVLEAFPIYSADSSSFIQTSIRGNIHVPINKKRECTVISLGRGSDKLNKIHFESLTAVTKDRVLGHIKSKGFTLEQLMESYQARMEYEVYYYAELRDNYKCTHKKTSRSLF